MKFGEPSADGRGSAPPELAEQQARAGSEAAPATPPLFGSTFTPLHRWGGGVKVKFFALLSHQKVTKRLFLAEIYDKIEDGRISGKGAILWELRFRV